MDYKRHYELLIAKTKNRKKPEGYTERHHVIPVSLGGTNACDNLVTLTGREHYLAHALLAKIHGGPMWRALYLMSARLRKNSRLYESSKLEFSKQQSAVAKVIGARNYQAGIGLAAISTEDRKKIASAAGKLGGKKGGSNPSSLPSKRRIGIKAKEAQTGIHSPGMCAKNGKKAGIIASERGQIQELQLKVAAIGGRASCLKRNFERYKCSECNFVSNVGQIGKHHKRTGHIGREKL